MNNSDLAFPQDPRRALQDSSPGPQLAQPSASKLLLAHPENYLSSRSQQQGQGIIGAQGLLTPQQQQSQQLFVMPPSNSIINMPNNMGFSSFLPADNSQYSLSTTFGNDMQRFQHLQQHQLGGGTATGQNGVFPQQQQQQQQQHPQQQQVPQQQTQQVPQQQPQQYNADFLRSLMNQKLQVQMPPYEADHMRQQRLLTAPAEGPLLQAPLLYDDARFVLAGNAINNNRQQQSFIKLPSPHELTLRDDIRRMRGGVIEPFPEKLHRLLTEVEVAGRSDVISFIATGNAFAIHKPDKFFKEIVPKYFRQSRLSSFKRQLNLYGFELINTGPARGGYYHEMFIKESPELCRRMRRVAVKLQPNKQHSQDNGKDADFYNGPQKNRNTAGPNENVALAR
jgi:hypothetical protein